MLFGFYVGLISGILSYVYRFTDAGNSILSDEARVSILGLLIPWDYNVLALSSSSREGDS